ncbi:MAG: hypothetical protein JOZ15_11900 [Acidobacteria bacterium]|nr:hypothetical protein [Acidobacteriota bacterium]
MSSGHWLHAVLLPLTDAWRGLDRCLERGAWALARAGAGLLAGWWIYVPAHELLHAVACRAAGGEVRRLEIAPLYGGAVLARLLPFVTAGGDYAGRLSGFDTHGSDLVYLATDLGPFVLTLLPGVWWLRRAARDRRAFAFGASLPVALAPLLSSTGDAYEIGAILLTRLPPWAAPATRRLLRGDDLWRRLGAIAEAAAPPASARWPLWLGAALAAGAGLAWALLTYAAGGGLARLAGQPALGGGPSAPGGRLR